jgi:hypothetical protein
VKISDEFFVLAETPTNVFVEVGLRCAVEVMHARKCEYEGSPLGFEFEAACADYQKAQTRLNEWHGYHSAPAPLVEFSATPPSVPSSTPIPARSAGAKLDRPTGADMQVLQKEYARFCAAVHDHDFKADEHILKTHLCRDLTAEDSEFVRFIKAAEREKTRRRRLKRIRTRAVAYILSKRAAV